MEHIEAPGSGLGNGSHNDGSASRYSIASIVTIDNSFAGGLARSAGGKPDTPTDFGEMECSPADTPLSPGQGRSPMIEMSPDSFLRTGVENFRRQHTRGLTRSPTFRLVRRVEEPAVTTGSAPKSRTSFRVPPVTPRRTRIKMSPKKPGPIPRRDRVDFTPKNQRIDRTIVTPRRQPNVKQPNPTIGPYILGNRLGSGSNGTVVVGKNLMTGDLVAVKVIPKATSSDPNLSYTVAKEIGVMKLMSHPNVVQFKASYEDQKNYYVMMEYCQGTELFQLLTKFGPLREDQALPLFRQMLSAVYYCQMINVAHRDIKPENMVVTFENRVKIIDFGLCSIAGKNIFMSTLCGSPHYVAPEILQSKEYDGRKVDVYSLGVVLYVMLVAKSPFSDSRPAPTIAEMRAGHFIKSWFSPLMRDLLSRMLHFDPEKRIKLRELWDHPLVKKFSPHERLPGRPADVLSGAVGIADVAEPLLGDGDEVDPETMRNLIGLHPGMEETHIYHQLRSRQNKNAHVYPKLSERQISGGQKATELLANPPTLRAFRTPGTLSTVPSTIGYYTESLRDIFDHKFRELLPPDENQVNVEEVKSPVSDKPTLEEYMKILQKESEGINHFDSPELDLVEDCGVVEIPYLGQDIDEPMLDDDHSGKPVGAPVSGDSERDQDSDEYEDLTPWGSEFGGGNDISRKRNVRKRLCRVMQAHRERSKPQAKGKHFHEGMSIDGEDSELRPEDSFHLIESEEKLVEEGSDGDVNHPTNAEQQFVVSDSGEKNRVEYLGGWSLDHSGSEDTVLQKTPTQRPKALLGDTSEVSLESFQTRRPLLGSGGTTAPDTPTRKRGPSFQTGPTLSGDVVITMQRLQRRSRDIESYVYHQALMTVGLEGQVPEGSLYEVCISPGSVRGEPATPGSRTFSFSDSSAAGSFVLSPLRKSQSSFCTGSMATQKGSAMTSCLSRRSSGLIIEQMNARLRPRGLLPGWYSVPKENNHAKTVTPDSRFADPASSKRGTYREGAIEDGLVVSRIERRPQSRHAPERPPFFPVQRAKSQFRSHGEGRWAKGLQGDPTLKEYEKDGRFREYGDEATDYSEISEIPEPSIPGPRAPSVKFAGRKPSGHRIPEGDNRLAVPRAHPAEGGSRTLIFLKATFRNAVNKLTERRVLRTENKKRGLMELFKQTHGVEPDDEGYEDVDELEDVERDEYTRIAKQQTWIKRMLRMMPSYVFTCFNLPAAGAYELCIKQWKLWRTFGLIILQDDHKGLVMRCKIPDVPHMCVKACEVVLEVRVAQGNRRLGTSVARLTLEKGSQSSFHFLHDSLERELDATINRKPHEVTRMLRTFI